jgi:hypothetical protein
MMFQHMNKISACLFVLMIVSPLYAQDRQPIIDMHLHAYPVGHFWPETIETGIESIKTAEFLTGEQKRDILYNNAARFLRLSEDEIARHHEYQ